MPADTVSISATSSGVTGTIITGKGARLKQLTFNFNDVDGQPQIIELTWVGSPTPMKFVPNIASFPMATSGAALMFGSPIPLDVVVETTDTVTIKVTSNANVVVQVGLIWT